MINLDRIKKLAKERHISISAVNRDYGEEPGYLDKVASGLRKITPDRIEHIAKILGTTVEYITGQTEEFPTVQSCPGKFDYNRFLTLCMKKRVMPGVAETSMSMEPGRIQQTVDGITSALTDREINQIAVYFDTTYAYLTGQTDNPAIPDDDRTGVKIGVFGEVAAGIPLQQIDNFDPDDADSWEEIDRNTAKNGSYFALRIKGNSMEPRIYNGDVVIVREQSTVDSGDIAVVAINGDTATCKKVVWDAGGGMFLIALNSAYQPMYFSASEIQTKPVTILGKVVELRGKL